MEYKDIVIIAKKSGLFKIIKPIKSGAILESLDEKKIKLATNAHNKVSALSDISIYQKKPDTTISLKEVFYKIYDEFGDDIGIDKKSDHKEIKSFFLHILPEYDDKKVYISDIKKMISWYNILLKEASDILKRPLKKKKKTTK